MGYESLCQTHPMLPIFPPFRFACVEENLYRGAYPKERNYRFLKRLKLRSILSLTPSSPTAPLLAFCDKNGIQSIHVKVDKPKEDIPLTFSQVTSILKLILEPSNHPMFVHCLDGTLVTGMIVACLRKVQCRSNSSALKEYSRFFDEEDVASPEESDFLEKYQTELEINIENAPTWIPIPPKRHPVLKVKYLRNKIPSANNEPADLNQQGSVQSSLSDLESIQQNPANTGHFQFAPAAVQSPLSFPATSPPFSLENSQSQTSAAFKAEKEQLRQRLIDLNMSFSRRAMHAIVAESGIRSAAVQEEPKQPKAEPKEAEETDEKLSLVVKGLALENHF